MKPGILVLNFGGPRSDDELEPFLANLFADVLPIPAWLGPLVIPRIARSRARKVRPAYVSIGWSPLVATTLEQVDLLRARVDVPVAAGMQFTSPTIDDALDELGGQGVDALVALGLFPQYSLTTTGSSYAMLDATLARRGCTWPVTKVRSWHDHPDYVAALADTVRTGVAGLDGEGPIDLLFSPHGLPMSVVRKGDPYPDQVRQTAESVVAALGWTDPWHLGWQSRVGPVKWLSPSTEEVLRELGAGGRQRVCVVPLSFVGEHIETLYEIDVEYAAVAKRAGIAAFGRAPALGTHPGLIAALADVAGRALLTASGAG